MDNTQKEPPILTPADIVKKMQFVQSSAQAELNGLKEQYDQAMMELLPSFTASLIGYRDMKHTAVLKGEFRFDHLVEAVKNPLEYMLKNCEGQNKPILTRAFLVIDCGPVVKPQEPQTEQPEPERA